MKVKIKILANHYGLPSWSGAPLASTLPLTRNSCGHHCHRAGPRGPRTQGHAIMEWGPCPDVIPAGWTQLLLALPSPFPPPHRGELSQSPLPPAGPASILCSLLPPQLSLATLSIIRLGGQPYSTPALSCSFFPAWVLLALSMWMDAYEPPPSCQHCHERRPWGVGTE